jgi:hypothetical protein
MEGVVFPKHCIVKRSYRAQHIYCNQRGYVVYEDCIHCGEKLIMCRVFGGQCRSKKCKDLREKLN